MMVAANLATRFNVPLAVVDDFDGQNFMSSGPRCKGNVPGAGDLILVDDTVHRGDAMFQAVREMGGSAGSILRPFKVDTWKVVPAAAIVSGKQSVCLHGAVLPSPRVFAWNWLNSWLSEKTVVDFDGVLCKDPDFFDDDPEAYEDHIAGLPPLWLPTKQPHAIVTHRLERFRETSYKWLKNFNLHNAPMTMRSDGTAAERRVSCSPYGVWKGQCFKSLPDAVLFVESDALQARRIFKVAGKTVYCPSEDLVLS